MIRILIVEDSEVIATILRLIFDEQPDMEVVGIARSGVEAIALQQQLQADLITMDIRLPQLDGLSAIREIMSTKAVPIVVISSNVDDELQINFRAIDEGALAVLEKPSAITDEEFASIQQQIVTTCRAMAEVKVVKRRRKALDHSGSFAMAPAALPVQYKHSYRLVAIGCSTGGPQVLKSLFNLLPTTFPLPIMVVQHISAGFIYSLAQWLHEGSSLPVQVAIDGEPLLPGHIYLAPDGSDMLVEDRNQQLWVRLRREKEPESSFFPSVNSLFYSVAQQLGPLAVGVILSGMGDDGSDGMMAMREQGGFTLAQEPQGAILASMPASAIERGAASEVATMEQIVQRLTEIV